MAKKRKHTTTKNTLPKNPVTRLAEYTLNVNGEFTLVTDITDGKKFDKVYREWFDHPTTRSWCDVSLIVFIKEKYPDCMCLLKQDFQRIVEGKHIPATREEWEAENN